MNSIKQYSQKLTRFLRDIINQRPRQLVIVLVILVTSVVGLVFFVSNIRQQTGIFSVSASEQNLFKARGSQFEADFGDPVDSGAHRVHFYSRPVVHQDLDREYVESMLKNRPLLVKIADWFKTLFKAEKKRGISFELISLQTNSTDTDITGKLAANLMNKYQSGLSYEDEKLLREQINVLFEMRTDFEVSSTLTQDEDGNDVLLHPDIIESTDIRYALLGDHGIKEEIIIRKGEQYNPQCMQQVIDDDNIGSLADKCSLPHNVFVMTYQLDEGVSLRKSLDGVENVPGSIWYLVDEYRRYLGHFEPLFAIDAAGNRTNDVMLNIAGGRMTVTVDLSWMMDPSRQYPIVIDPSIVHDSLSEFNDGVENRLDTTADPRVQSTYHELPADEHTVGVWHMNETANNSCSGGEDACDASGNGNHGTESGTTINSSSNKLGAAAREFDGSSCYVNVGDLAEVDNNRDEITIEAWFNLDSYPTGDNSRRSIVSKYDHDQDQREFYLIIGQLPTTTWDIIGWSVQENPASYSSATEVWSDQKIELDRWYHVAAVYKGGQYMRLYIDGELEKELTSGVPTDFADTSENIYIGSYDDGADLYFDGTIDEVRISSIARTPEEIKASAQLYPYGVYTSDILDLGPNPTIDDLQWGEQGVATGDGETPYSTTNLYAQWDLNESSGTTANNDAEGSSCDGLPAHCDGTLNGFSDTSGQDTAVFSGWTSDNRRWGSGALMLDGIDDFVQSSNDVEPTQNITLATWVKPFDTEGQIAGMGSYDDAGTSKNYSLDLSSGKLRFYANTGETTDEFVETEETYSDGNWHYVVGTYDGTNIKLYVDGVLQNATSASGSISYYSESRFTIGARRYGSNPDRYLKGVVDSVSVYERVFSEQEIISSYQSGQIEFQTRTGADDTPNDGDWEAWSPATSESQIDDMDAAMSDTGIIDTAEQSIPVAVYDTDFTTPTGPAGCSDSELLHINNSANNADLTNFQVNFIVPYLSGMSSDFSDLRFTSADGTDFDYWIEEYTASTEATVWVEVDSISAGAGEYMYMWYDSCTGGNSSNAGNTFLMFDDFEDGDVSDWTTYGSGTFEAYSTQTIEGSYSARIYSGNNVTNLLARKGSFTDAIIEADVQGIAHVDSDTIMVAARSTGTNSENNLYAGAIQARDNDIEFWINGSFSGTINETINNTQLYNLKLAVTGNYLKFFVDGVQKINTRSNSNSSAGGWGFTVSEANAIVDNVLVREFADHDPVVTFANIDSAPKMEGDGVLQADIGKLQADKDTVGLWHFEETSGTGAYVKDESIYGNDGTPSGIVTTKGINGLAVGYDSSGDDEIVLGSSILPTGAKTIEAWVLLNPVGSGTGIDYDYFLYHKRDGTNGDFIMYYNDGTELRVLNAPSGDYIAYTFALDDGEWHHVAYTYDGTTEKLFIDGDEVQSDTGVDSISAGVENIGGDEDDTHSRGWYGKIDELRISNRARTAEEIYESYRNASGYQLSLTTTSTDLSSKTKLPVWIAADRPGTYLSATYGESDVAQNQYDSDTWSIWHLEEPDGSGEYIYDSSGNGAWGSTTGTNYTRGKVGMGRLFDENEYVRIDDFVEFGNTGYLTVCLWFQRYQDLNLATAQGAQNVVASKTEQGITDIIEIGTDSGDVDIYLATDNNSSLQSIGAGIQDDIWYHLAFTYDKDRTNEGNVFINGVLVGEISSWGGDLLNSAAPFALGISRPGSGATGDFNGIIDEVYVSGTARSAEEIRQMYEHDLRSQNITIDFAATLQSGYLIADSNDTSFRVDATTFGSDDYGGELFLGDKIIIRENVDGTYYTAQGTVTGVTYTTGAVTVASWDSGSTFPNGGFTQYATAMKWQREYIDVRESLSGHRDAVTRLNFRILDGYEGRTVWIDDVTAAGPYLTDPTATSNISSTDQRYVQYRFLLNSFDTVVTPYIEDVTLNYTEGSAEPTNDLLMRHGKWFDSGSEQGFWWAS